MVLLWESKKVFSSLLAILVLACLWSSTVVYAGEKPFQTTLKNNEVTNLSTLMSMAKEQLITPQLSGYTLSESLVKYNTPSHIQYGINQTLESRKYNNGSVQEDNVQTSLVFTNKQGTVVPYSSVQQPGDVSGSLSDYGYTVIVKLYYTALVDPTAPLTYRINKIQTSVVKGSPSAKVNSGYHFYRVPLTNTTFKDLPATASQRSFSYSNTSTTNPQTFTYYSTDTTFYRSYEPFIVGISGNADISLSNGHSVPAICQIPYSYDY